MFTLSQACFRTSRSDSFVDDFSVSVCFDNFLFYEDFTTDGTMLTFRQACFRASRRNCFVNDFGVSVCFDDFLFYQDFTANGTMLTFRQACFRTSRRYGFINHDGMTKCIHIIIHIAVVTHRTSISGITLRSASGRCNNSLIFMLTVQNIDLIAFTIIPHRDIDSNRTFRGNQITAIRGKFCIGFSRCRGFQNTINIEKCHADTIGCTVHRS